MGEFINELSRGIRLHLHKYLKITEEEVSKTQLGLGHQYSRMKCMFDVNREDKPIIQSIALIDQLDKNINSFCMRIKEWFAWHFPELNRLVSDNTLYVQLVKLVETRKHLLDNKEELQEQIQEITNNEELTKQILDGAFSSMGGDLSEMDLYNVRYFCDKVLNLIKYREELLIYLRNKMKMVAPNTCALIGETLSARMISHAGSLSNLAKYPASTIQILGAEKALFRALKTKGKTPKYGLLYHSSFIGKAIQKNKGKISRHLANKIAQSSRIDFFSDNRGSDYGEEFKKQVEERLTFLGGGIKPRKNVDVMKEVSSKLQLPKDDDSGNDSEKETVQKELLQKKKKRKNSKSEMIIKEQEVVKEKKSKKKPKSTKKVEDSDVDSD